MNEQIPVSSREADYLRRETEGNLIALERWYEHDLERRAELSQSDGPGRRERRHEEDR